jgi:hypothetical protein
VIDFNSESELNLIATLFHSTQKAFLMTETPQGIVGQIPSYTITRRQDLSLQFNPPVGSVELANALALKYPLEQNLESQLRRALMDHLGSEPSISPTTGQPPSGMSSPKAFDDDEKTPADSWRITTGNPAVLKRKRSTFDRAKRKKVAEVRKRGACEVHRRKKTEVGHLFHKKN